LSVICKKTGELKVMIDATGDPDHAEDLVWNATLQMTDPHEWATLRKEVEEGGGANWSNWQIPQPAGSFVGVIDTQDLYVSIVT
jgi:hypothetical protein